MDTTALQVSQFHSEVERERWRIMDKKVKVFMFIRKMSETIKLQIDCLPFTCVQYSLDTGDNTRQRVDKIM